MHAHSVASVIAFFDLFYRKRRRIQCSNTSPKTPESLPNLQGSDSLGVISTDNIDKTLADNITQGCAADVIHSDTENVIKGDIDDLPSSYTTTGISTQQSDLSARDTDASQETIVGYLDAVAALVEQIKLEHNLPHNQDAGSDGSELAHSSSAATPSLQEILDLVAVAQRKVAFLQSYIGQEYVALREQATNTQQVDIENRLAARSAASAERQQRRENMQATVMQQVETQRELALQDEVEAIGRQQSVDDVATFEQYAAREQSITQQRTQTDVSKEGQREDGVVPQQPAPHVSSQRRKAIRNSQSKGGAASSKHDSVQASKQHGFLPLYQIGGSAWRTYMLSYVAGVFDRCARCRIDLINQRKATRILIYYRIQLIVHPRQAETLKLVHQVFNTSTEGAGKLRRLRLGVRRLVPYVPLLYQLVPYMPLQGGRLAALLLAVNVVNGKRNLKPGLQGQAEEALCAFLQDKEDSMWVGNVVASVGRLSSGDVAGLRDAVAQLAKARECQEQDPTIRAQKQQPDHSSQRLAVKSEGPHGTARAVTESGMGFGKPSDQGDAVELSSDQTRLPASAELPQLQAHVPTDGCGDVSSDTFLQVKQVHSMPTSTALANQRVARFFATSSTECALGYIHGFLDSLTFPVRLSGAQQPTFRVFVKESQEAVLRVLSALLGGLKVATQSLRGVPKKGFNVKDFATVELVLALYERPAMLPSAHRMKAAALRDELDRRLLLRLGLQEETMCQGGQKQPRGRLRDIDPLTTHGRQEHTGVDLWERTALNMRTAGGRRLTTDRLLCSPDEGAIAVQSAQKWGKVQLMWDGTEGGGKQIVGDEARGRTRRVAEMRGKGGGDVRKRSREEVGQMQGLWKQGNTDPAVLTTVEGRLPTPAVGTQVPDDWGLVRQSEFVEQCEKGLPSWDVYSSKTQLSDSTKPPVTGAGSGDVGDRFRSVATEVHGPQAVGSPAEHGTSSSQVGVSAEATSSTKFGSTIEAPSTPLGSSAIAAGFVRATHDDTVASSSSTKSQPAAATMGDQRTWLGLYTLLSPNSTGSVRPNHLFAASYRTTGRDWRSYLLQYVAGVLDCCAKFDVVSVGSSTAATYEVQLVVSPCSQCTIEYLKCLLKQPTQPDVPAQGAVLKLVGNQLLPLAPLLVKLARQMPLQGAKIEAFLLAVRMGTVRELLPPKTWESAMSVLQGCIRGVGNEDSMWEGDVTLFSDEQSGTVAHVLSQIDQVLRCKSKGHSVVQLPEIVCVAQPSLIQYSSLSQTQLTLGIQDPALQLQPAKDILQSEPSHDPQLPLQPLMDNPPSHLPHGQQNLKHGTQQAWHQPTNSEQSSQQTPTIQHHEQRPGGDLSRGFSVGYFHGYFDCLEWPIRVYYGRDKLGKRYLTPRLRMTVPMAHSAVLSALLACVGGSNSVLTGSSTKRGFSRVEINVVSRDLIAAVADFFERPTHVPSVHREKLLTTKMLLQSMEDDRSGGRRWDSDRSVSLAFWSGLLMKRSLQLLTQERPECYVEQGVREGRAVAEASQWGDEYRLVGAG